MQSQATRILEDLALAPDHDELADKLAGLRSALDGGKRERAKAAVLNLIEDARRELG